VNTARKGRRGEETAVEYLENHGFSVLERNYRSCGAEIDIVCSLGDTIVFVEVKNWDAYGFEEMSRAVDRNKMRRIVRASNGYLSAHPCYRQCGVRYDVVFMSGAGSTFEHIEDAFTETGAI
jgi:putative endonuclease